MQFRSLAPPVAVALLLMLVGTVIHGGLTDRFGMVRSEQLVQFTARLEGVPASFGPWEGEDNEADPRQLARAKVTGHVSRTYRNAATGDVVSMFLVAGTSRHITLHTPDLCYQSAGFEMEDQPRAYPVDAGLSEPMELSTSKFYREEGAGRLAQLRIYWSFSHDGAWHGPRWARTSLAGKGAMYKIYLIAPVQGASEGRLDEGPVVAFLKAAMPEIQDTLFPAETQ